MMRAKADTGIRRNRRKRQLWKQAAPQTDFFPDATDDFIITNTQLKPSQNATTITFTAQPIDTKNTASGTLQCVLGYQNDEGKRRGILIPVALAAGIDKNR